MELERGGGTPSWLRRFGCPLSAPPLPSLILPGSQRHGPSGGLRRVGAGSKAARMGGAPGARISLGLTLLESPNQRHLGMDSAIFRNRPGYKGIV